MSKVRIGTQAITKKDGFKYLSYMIQENGEIELKSFRASRVLCNKKVLLKHKGKFYGVVVKPTLMYEVECWQIKEVHIQKMMVVEMRTIRWLCDHTLRDKMKNKAISEKVGKGPYRG